MVRLYDSDFSGQGYHFRINLDTRGDERRDFSVFFEDAPLRDCDVYGYRPFRRVGGCGFTPSDGNTRFNVWVRWYLLHASKHIRWWVEAPPLFTDNSDRAPNQGWYS
jgi:hypothetical protein